MRSSSATGQMLKFGYCATLDICILNPLGDRVAYGELRSCRAYIDAAERALTFMQLDSGPLLRYGYLHAEYAGVLLGDNTNPGLESVESWRQVSGVGFGMADAAGTMLLGCIA
jgi:hypothetical protein